MNGELQLVIIISEKNLADRIVSSISAHASMPFVVRGKGTAPNSVIEALGLGEPEKDIVFCFASKKEVPKIYSILSKKFRFIKNKKGIAFAIPLSAVGGSLTMDLMLKNSKKIIRSLTDKEKNNE